MVKINKRLIILAGFKLLKLKIVNQKSGIFFKQLLCKK